MHACLATPRDLLLHASHLSPLGLFCGMHACYQQGGSKRAEREQEPPAAAAAYATFSLLACIVIARMPRQPLGCFSFVLSLGGD